MFKEGVAGLNRSAFVMSARLIGNPSGLMGGTSSLIKFAVDFSLSKYYQERSSAHPRPRSSVNEELIRERRECLSFSL